MKYKIRKQYSTNPDVAIEEILQDRGVRDVQSFMHPTHNCEISPYNLENIEAAADMLLRHLRQNSFILFIVDSDCDGYTSSAILWLYIKSIFPNASLYFRTHEHKQHGLEDHMDYLDENADFDLIICPDAASYDIEEHRKLGELGMDILVLDHHAQEYDKQGNPKIPTSPNTIVVNNQLSPRYSNKSLCGAGMAYKFCEVLDDRLGISQASNYIDLAALGEIADVMDRTDIETNYIMMEGLKHIRNGGFKALLKSVENSPSLKDRAKPPYIGLTPIDVAFYIAPLVNAITRVGRPAEKENLFYCFIEPDKLVPSTKRGALPSDKERVSDQAARAGGNAKSRQDTAKERALGLIDFKIQKDGLADNNIIIVELDESDNIPPELTGLIATNVVNKYNKPVMIGRRNSDNSLQGSIRSNGNFAGLPSFKTFLENSKLLNYTAGHDNAAGWGLNGDKLSSLIEYGNTHLKASDFENCYLVDYALNSNDNIEPLLTALAEHPEYFGNHVDEIKVVVKDIPLASVMVMGANKNCMKISHNNVDYVRFKDEDFIEEVMNNRTKKLTIYGSVNLNEFNGMVGIQCFIDDYELTSDDSKYDF